MKRFFINLYILSFSLFVTYCDRSDEIDLSKCSKTNYTIDSSNEVYRDVSDNIIKTIEYIDKQKNLYTAFYYSGGELILVEEINGEEIDYIFLKTDEKNYVVGQYLTNHYLGKVIDCEGVKINETKIGLDYPNLITKNQIKCAIESSYGIKLDDNQIDNIIFYIVGESDSLPNNTITPLPHEEKIK